MALRPDDGRMDARTHEVRPRLTKATATRIPGVVGALCLGECVDTVNIFVTFVAGLALGALAMWAALRRSSSAGDVAGLAAAQAERDVLRERVVDLEATVSDDAQTAALLGPLRDALSRVERQVSTLERDRVEQFGSVDVALRRVSATTEELRRETSSLAGSLNASSVRGQWGESQLRRILELSGMLRRCDFDEQWRGHNDEGTPVRPDVVVHLPGERTLVIDAKAPMSAFMAAQESSLDEQARSAALTKHSRQLRSHVDTLASKRYWTALADAPAFVICFVPSDAILASALNADPGLLEDAMERHVVLASPSTLIATMRSVAAMWQQATLEENARELLDLGRELYERVGVLAKHTHDLGGSLRRSVEAYNLFVGSLESRVLVTAKRLHDLDVSTKPPREVSPETVTPRPLTHEALLTAALEPTAEVEAERTVTDPRAGARLGDDERRPRQAGSAS